MRRLIALALGLLAGLGLTACLDYDDELFEYCARQGTCSCEGDSCCAARSQPCSQALECCEGTFCSGRRLCEGPVVLVSPTFNFSQSWVPSQSIKEVKLINYGVQDSLPIEVVAEGDATRFQLDASECSGKPLGAGTQCSVWLTNTTPTWVAPQTPDPDYPPPPPNAPVLLRITEQGGSFVVEHSLLLVNAFGT